jgi:hypothetical protein
MTELFISKDGITYQEAKGEIEFNFVDIPDEISKSANGTIKLIQCITVCTNDADTMNLLSSSTTIFIKYVVKKTNATGKQGTITLYEQGTVYIVKSYDEDFYDGYYEIKVKDRDYSLKLKTLAEKNLEKATEIVADEYLKSITMVEINIDNEDVANELNYSLSMQNESPRLSMCYSVD